MKKIHLITIILAMLLFAGCKFVSITTTTTTKDNNNTTLDAVTTTAVDNNTTLLELGDASIEDIVAYDTDRNPTMSLGLKKSGDLVRISAKVKNLGESDFPYVMVRLYIKKEGVKASYTTDKPFAILIPPVGNRDAISPDEEKLLSKSIHIPANLEIGDYQIISVAASTRRSYYGYFNDSNFTNNEGEAIFFSIDKKVEDAPKEISLNNFNWSNGTIAVNSTATQPKSELHLESSISDMYGKVLLKETIPIEFLDANSSKTIRVLNGKEQEFLGGEQQILRLIITDEVGNFLSTPFEFGL